MRGRVSTASTLQRLGLRAVGRLGGLRALADPERRRAVEGLLRRGAQAGYSAQVAAGRAFVKRLDSVAASSVANEELSIVGSRRATVVKPPVSDDIELF